MSKRPSSHLPTLKAFDALCLHSNFVFAKSSLSSLRFFTTSFIFGVALAVHEAQARETVALNAEGASTIDTHLQSGQRIKIIEQPKHGNATINADGTIRYSSTSQSADGLKYQILDAQGNVISTHDVIISLEAASSTGGVIAGLLAVAGLAAAVGGGLSSTGGGSGGIPTPVARDDSFSTNEDTLSPEFNALTNTIPNGADSPGVGALTAHTQTGTSAQGADYTFDADGKLTYNTNDNFQSLAQGDNIEDEISYTVFDDNGAMSSAVMTITVLGVNDIPIVANVISDQAANEDAAFSFTFAANTFFDIDDGDVLTYSATLSDDSPLPGWLSFNPNTREFSGTPTNDDVGTLSIKVTATDLQGATVSELFDIVISNTNDAPTVENVITNQNINEDSLFDFTFANNTFNDVDVGDTLTYTATLDDDSALPLWLTFTPGTRNFTGTPLNGDVGTITVKITASDGLASVNTSFDIIVNNTNDAPTASNTSKAGTEDIEFNFTQADFTSIFSDVDVGDSLEGIRITSLETAGDLEINNVDVQLGVNNAISLADLSNLSFITDPNGSGSPYATFEFEVYDGEAYSAVSYTMTINITAQNDAPVITTSSSQSINEGQTDVVTVQASDPDGPPTTFSIIGGADQALFDIDTNTGALSFKVAPDYENPGDFGTNNIYEVQVRASDGTLNDDVTFSITVNDILDTTLDAATDGWKITGIAGSDFGYSIASVGDIDGSGVDDILIGAPEYNSNGASVGHEGAAYLIYGETITGSFDIADLNTIGNPTGVIFTVNNEGDDGIGFSVAGGEDIDGNGVPDFLIGAPTADGTGKVYVVYGEDVSGTSYDLESDGADIITGNTGSLFGYSVAVIEDIDGNGQPDILVGAPEEDTVAGGSNEGAVYLIYGEGIPSFDISSFTATEGIIFSTSVDGDNNIGSSITTGADIDGMGTSDFLIGADNIGSFGGVFYIKSENLSGTSIDLTNNFTDSTFIDGDDSSSVGFSVAILGDVDGNGDLDILIGAPLDNSSGGALPEGAAFLLLGENLGAVSLKDITSTEGTLISSDPGNDETNSIGYSLASLGDINSDTYDDFLITAINEDGSGNAYIVYGFSTITNSNINIDTSTSVIQISGASSSGDFGISSSLLNIDFNNNNINDFIIGATDEAYIFIT